MTEQPDHLAAEARRWLGRVGYSTEPAIIKAVVKGLARYYDDMAVVEGIVKFRTEPPEHSRKLLATLGFGWEIDPNAPDKCDCGCATAACDDARVSELT